MLPSNAQLTSSVLCFVNKDLHLLMNVAMISKLSQRCTSGAAVDKLNEGCPGEVPEASGRRVGGG